MKSDENSEQNKDKTELSKYPKSRFEHHKQVNKSVCFSAILQITLRDSFPPNIHHTTF